MNIADLPVGKRKNALEFPHFPTRLQAVIWRNWGLVPVEKLASVLKASSAQVAKLASEMGLSQDDSLCSLWHERGYITIIRRNWHLLPYEQILALLGWTPDELAYVLKEDDFLWHKLGNLKPDAEPVYYSALSDDEIQKTIVFKNWHDQYFSESENIKEYPFDFIKRYGQARQIGKTDSKRFGMRLAYSYSAVYGDPLLNKTLDPYPDGLLADYAAAGINAVWLQGTLYTLIPWFGESKYSDGWRVRLDNLNDLCQRAAKHGIKVYLYLNEPRSMPPEFFNDHSDWQGVQAKDGLSFTLCTSKKTVLDALREGVSALFRNVPELGGIFTITMSENLTNCCSRKNDIAEPCPVCSSRGAAEVVAEINRVIAEGVHRIKPEADVIAWTWAWSPEWDERAIELLSKDVKLMCVSETAVPTDAQGIKGKVLDYSISKVGPGPVASRLWKKALQCGLSAVAKVQLNNTWECSAIPYIPATGLVEQHLSNLEQAGVKDLMLSWTLGGYPGGNFELLKMSKEELAEEKFGAGAASMILQAWSEFDRAFEAFPLNSTEQLYLAPQNMGPLTLFAEKPTGYSATMIGFPYDDLTGWRGNHYPEAIFEEQFRKLSEGWNEGMKILRDAKEKIPADKMADFDDLFNVAEAGYCHFRSSYLQIRFVRLRDSGENKQIIPLLDEEISLAKRLLKIMKRDSRIGFEASNHYYYTFNDLKEKIIACEYLKKRF